MVGTLLSLSATEASAGSATLKSLRKTSRLFLLKLEIIVCTDNDNMLLSDVKYLRGSSSSKNDHHE